MKKITALLMAISLLWACKEDDKPQPETSGYSVLIGNEGNFPDGIGTLSLYDKNSGEVERNVYQKANNEPMGSVINSILVDGDYAFFVANGTGSVVATDAEDFVQVKVFKNLDNPRHIVKAGPGKYYVSSWGEEGLYVLDMSSRSITGTIPTGTGPERMIAYKDWVLVTNGAAYSSGSIVPDSTVAVINTANDQLVAKFKVGENPNSLQIDKHNRLWVLSSGIADYTNPEQSTPGTLQAFSLDSIEAHLSDPASITALKSFTFPDPANKPNSLLIDREGENLFFLHQGYSSDVIKMSTAAQNLPQTAFISGGYYGIGIEHESNEIYTGDALSFSENGKIERFSADDGQLIDDFKAGIIPGSFAFR